MDRIRKSIRKLRSSSPAPPKAEDPIDIMRRRMIALLRVDRRDDSLFREHAAAILSDAELDVRAIEDLFATDGVTPGPKAHVRFSNEYKVLFQNLDMSLTKRGRASEFILQTLELNLRLVELDSSPDERIQTLSRIAAARLELGQVDEAASIYTDLFRRYQHGLVHLTEPPDPGDHHSMFVVLGGNWLCQAIEHVVENGVELPEDIDGAKLADLCEQIFGPPA